MREQGVAPRTRSSLLHFSLLVLCGAIAFARGEAASAGTIRVPADQPTIQAAVDAAVSGDEVLVAPGTYTGVGNKDIQIELKDIAVRSEGGPEVTVIDCEGSGRGFFVVGVNAPVAVIEGFTIANGDGDGGEVIGGGGMFIGGGSPTIRNCVFRNNTAGGDFANGGGGGLVCHGAFSLLENCTFEDNSSIHGGGLAMQGSSLVIRGCRFVRNMAARDGGGLGMASPGLLPDTIVEDCEFVDNLAQLSGSALVSDCRVDRCHFEGNIARNGAGGGITALGSSLIDCTFMANAAHTLGGGVELGDNSQLAACRVLRNRAQYGGGVWIDAPGAVMVEDCTITDNVAEIGGGILCYGREPSTIRRCTIARNSAPSGSGIAFSAMIHPASNELEESIVTLGDGTAIECYGTASLSVSCTDIFGNAGGNWVGCVVAFAGINGNIEADPLFCDPGADDWRLCEQSPCAPPQAGDCGQIGAFGVGCSCPIAVEPATWGQIKARSLSP